MATADTSAISNVIDYDMNVAEAVNAPRVYRDQNSKNLTIESRYSQETMDKLTALGFSLTNEGELGSHVGCVAAVCHGADGRFYAAADHRRFYGSAAY